MKAPVPCLRIFDEAKALDFYVDYLGFIKDWEHRHEAHFPIYLQVSRGDCVLHLSEHHGDCCPGASVMVPVDDIDALHAELSARHYRMQRPGIEKMPWGSRDISVTDPFGNKIRFSTPEKT